MTLLKIVIVLTVFILFAGIIFLFIDTRVTIDHMSQRIAAEEVAQQEILRLLNVAFIGKKRSDVDVMVREAFSNTVTKLEEKQISAGQLIFKFENGNCISVSDINR